MSSTKPNTFIVDSVHSPDFIQLAETPAKTPFDNRFQATFEARARVKQAFGNLLLDSSFGKALVQAGVFTNPAAKERQEQTHRLEEIISLYQNSGLFHHTTNFQQIALTEPDMQPLKRPDMAFLEKRYSNKGIGELNKILAANEFSKIAGLNLDLVARSNEQPLDKIARVAAALVAKEEGKLYNNLIYAALRDKLLGLAAHHEWQKLADMILNLFSHPVLKKPFLALLQKVGNGLFNNPDFHQIVAPLVETNPDLHDLAGFLQPPRRPLIA